jgi:hypothetical protein
MDIVSEIQAMMSRVSCGQIFVPTAQAGRPFRVGRALVALKMEKVVLSMDITMKEQARLVERRRNLAMRTRVLTFYVGRVVSMV